MEQTAPTASPPIALLGPQRFDPHLKATLEQLEVRGRLAVVTAGWQEREDEDGELREHVAAELSNLQLYKRYDRVLRDDPELAEALRERQDRLHRLQRLYRMRLDHALAPARELMRRRDADPLLDEHRRAAIRALRTLDRQHLTRLRSIHQEFDRRWRPTERPSVASQRKELAAELDASNGLLIAGGHVAVLLSRMRLFDVVNLSRPDCPIVAWTAGAMALSERVVLFHDSPPQGAGNPEVFEAGLSIVRRLVALPNASQRLDVEDPVRLALFARRFAPATCVMLDPGAALIIDGDRWSAGPETRRLRRGGAIVRMPSR